MISIRPRHGEPYSRMIADMHQIQAKAKMIYEKERSYATLNCNYDDDMKMMCDYIEKKLGFKPTIHQSDKEYCAYIKLNAEEYFCIDSTGFAEKITINPEKENYCDGRTFVCSGEKMKKEEVTIATDKTEYEQGELIKITVRNDLDVPILYYDSERFWGIEYLEDEEWKNLAYERGGGFQLTKEDINDICYIGLDERMPPVEMKSYSTLSQQWNQRICPFGEGDLGEPRFVEYIGTGRYRLIFYYGFEISNEDPHKTSNQKTIYSNEFTIKEKIITDETANWKTYRNEEYGFEFKYPADLSATGGREPKVVVTDCDYMNFPQRCPDIVEIGVAVARLEGYTSEQLEIVRNNFSDPSAWKKYEGEKITVNDIPYCLHITGDAAMGSYSVDSYYTTVRDSKCLTVNLFAIYTNCSHGYSPESEGYKECQDRNESTKETIDQMLSTFTLH